MGYSLHLGDCLEVMREMPDKSIDAVITDFPYGLGFEKKSNDYRSKYFDNGESLKASILYDDDPQEIKELIAQAMPEILRVAKRALIFSGHAMLMNYPEPASIGAVYMPAGAGRTKWGFQCFQPILFYGKDPYLQNGMGGRANSFQAIQPADRDIDHPCPKPIEWMNWSVVRASLEGETILDPFMGSGTTGVSCVLHNRNFIGIEKVPEYFATAEKRIQQAALQPSLWHATQQSVQRTANAASQQAQFFTDGNLPSKARGATRRR